MKIQNYLHLIKKQRYGKNGMKQYLGILDKQMSEYNVDKFEEF